MLVNFTRKSSCASHTTELIDIMRNVKIVVGRALVCNLEVSTVTIWTFFPRALRLAKTRLKISTATRFPAVRLESVHLCALSTLRSIRNLYRTNLRLHGGGSTVTKQPIGTRSIHARLHGSLILSLRSVFLCLTGEAQEFTTRCFQRPVTVCQQSHQSFEPSVAIFNGGPSSKATDVRVVGPIAPSFRPRAKTSQLRAIFALPEHCSSFDSAILGFLLSLSVNCVAHLANLLSKVFPCYIPWTKSYCTSLIDIN